MEEYVKWLEKMIEETLNDRDMSREHWAFYQSLKIYRETHHIIEKACVNCKFNKSETYHDKMWCRDCQRMNHFVSQSEGEKIKSSSGPGDQHVS